MALPLYAGSLLAPVVAFGRRWGHCLLGWVVYIFDNDGLHVTLGNLLQ